ncbi:MAG: glutaredoxin [Chloroflexi bacterium]|nr:glutaredoxin [Chloroflexota bacterium]
MRWIGWRKPQDRSGQEFAGPDSATEASAVHSQTVPPGGDSADGPTKGEPEPIIFYTKTGCPWVKAVRHLLDTHGVWYQERNASADARIFQELLRETRQPFVPTLKIGDEWLLDTDAKEVARRLGLPVPSRVLM